MTLYSKNIVLSVHSSYLYTTIFVTKPDADECLKLVKDVLNKHKLQHKEYIAIKKEIDASIYRNVVNAGSFIRWGKEQVQWGEMLMTISKIIEETIEQNL